MAPKGKRGRPKAMKQSTRAVVRSEQEREEPGVWITQLKDTINYGVRVYGSANKRNLKAAVEQFSALKRFVEIEVPQLTQANDEEKLKVSVERETKT